MYRYDKTKNSLRSRQRTEAICNIVFAFLTRNDKEQKQSLFSLTKNRREKHISFTARKYWTWAVDATYESFYVLLVPARKNPENSKNEG